MISSDSFWTVLKLDLSWIKKHLPGRSTDIDQKIDTMFQLIDEALNLLHTVTAELRPGVLDDFGLAAAIEWQLEQFSQHSGIACSFGKRWPLNQNFPEIKPRLFFGSFRRY